MANFADTIFQCEKSQHHWSYALKPSLNITETELLWKIQSQYLQHLQNYHEIFICHSAAAVTKRCCWAANLNSGSKMQILQILLFLLGLKSSFINLIIFF